MLRNTWVNTMYITNDIIEVQEIQYGNFNVNISFFTSPSFLYPVTHSPYYVDLDQNLYVQAEILHSDASLALFVDTCVASPYPSDSSSLTYDLIRRGCYRGCVVRSKRDVGPYQEKVDVILRPIQQQIPPEEKRSLDLVVAEVEKPGSSQGSSQNPAIAAGVFLALVLAVAAFTLGRTRSTSGCLLSTGM
ncbi:Deleted in malignant brain tumors 1 protein [Heterocephalus glaber]|uniref:Deleted in malignant brain tumors 1 protein n=1 Tax=Heterocephalus glaber TaxID=10181 RepID=G5C0B0_HETGA|nr:Deleted in malignant brain tumors 1 protein [Heterocephalus glaber]